MSQTNKTILNRDLVSLSADLFSRFDPKVYLKRGESSVSTARRRVQKDVGVVTAVLFIKSLFSMHFRNRAIIGKLAKYLTVKLLQKLYLLASRKRFSQTSQYDLLCEHQTQKNVCYLFKYLLTNAALRKKKITHAAQHIITLFFIYLLHIIGHHSISIVRQ